MSGPPPFPFVVGCSRSGTTLLRIMLDRHPDLAIPPESHFPYRLWNRRGRYEQGGRFDPDAFMNDLSTFPRFVEWGLDPTAVRERLREAMPATYADAIREIFRQYARAHGKPRYGDKTPSFVVEIPLLAGQFPEARFVHMIRDGRDVALSLVQRGFGPTGVAEAADFWGHRVTRGRSDGRALASGRYLEVRYEELLDDPQAVVAGVCAFIELDLRPEMLASLEGSLDKLPEARREHHEHLNEPLRKGIRDWRREMSGRDLEVFEAMAGRQLEEFGYERATEHIPLGTRLSVLGRRLMSRANWSFRHAKSSLRYRIRVRGSQRG